MKNHADLWLAYKEKKNFGDSSILKKFFLELRIRNKLEKKARKELE